MHDSAPVSVRVTVPLDDVNAVSDVLPDGLVVIDARATIRFVNRRAGEILQVDPVSLLDRPVHEALPLSDVDGRDWWSVADPWHGLPTLKGHREKLLWTSDGVEVLATAKYVRKARGARVSRVFVSLRDALARQRTEHDHAALISTLAHELRSPLTSVKGFSTTLLKHWDRFSDEQKRFVVETIEADAERVTRLVTDLLDVSRIDAGRLQLRRERMTLRPLVDRHMRRMQAMGIPLDRIRIQVHRPLPEVWADPDRLDQIVVNLVDNAVKHGEGTITVIVEPGHVGLGLTPGSHDGEAVVISVRDEGPGIPEHQRTLIFSRFWHTPGASNSGLGLYVVRALVEAHGGRIAALSAPGGGAELRFSIPAGMPQALRRDLDGAAGRD